MPLAALARTPAALARHLQYDRIAHDHFGCRDGGHSALTGIEAGIFLSGFTTSQARGAMPGLATGHTGA